jgi:hypothetical protein
VHKYAGNNDLYSADPCVARHVIGRLLDLSHISRRTCVADLLADRNRLGADASQLYGPLESKSAGGASAVWSLTVRRPGDSSVKHFRKLIFRGKVARHVVSARALPSRYLGKNLGTGPPGTSVLTSAIQDPCRGRTHAITIDEGRPRRPLPGAPA